MRVHTWHLYLIFCSFRGWLFINCKGKKLKNYQQFLYSFSIPFTAASKSASHWMLANYVWADPHYCILSDALSCTHPTIGGAPRKFGTGMWPTYQNKGIQKSNCCLFERLFKAKKNDVFLFGISFFVMEIFTFLYYANEESDDVIGGSTKTVQHSINNIFRNIGPVLFKLGTRNQHHKRRNTTPVILLPWQQLCCWFCFNTD